MQHYMKKYFSAVMAATLLLTMVGCSDKQPTEEIESSSKPISSSVAEPPVNEAQPAADAPKIVSENAPEQKEGGFPIPTMTEEQEKYNMQYVAPLRFSALLLRSWSPDDISQLEPKPEKSQTGAFMMFAFEDVIGSDAMQAIWKDYPDGQIPETVVDEVLLTRFSFSLDQLHQMNAFYKPEQKLYDYTGGRGGGPMETVVTDVTEREDGTVLLEYTVLSDFPDEARALYRVPGTMTLVSDGEGGYRYWSVEAKESEQY